MFTGNPLRGSLVNSEDPDEMQHYAAFHQGLHCLLIFKEPSWTEGVQWLSGRVLDSRPRGRRFDPHQRHCVGILEHDDLS